MKSRVLVVDGVPLTRFALGTLTNLHSAMVVCAEASTAPEARQKCAEAKPDLVILDLGVPLGDGVSLLRELRKLHPPVLLMAVNENDDALTMRRAFRAGAKGYVTRSDEMREFQEALERTWRGERYASRRVADALLKAMVMGEDGPFSTSLERLSDREFHVFQLIGNKQGPTAIASRLGVSVKTIETYQRRIQEKLRLPGCSELHQRALSWCSAGPHAPKT